MKNDASCRTAQGNIILLTQNKYDLIYTIIRNSYNSMQSKNSMQDKNSMQSKNSIEEENNKQSKNSRSIKTRKAWITYYKISQASVKKTRLPGCFASFSNVIFQLLHLILLRAIKWHFHKKKHCSIHIAYYIMSNPLPSLWSFQAIYLFHKTCLVDSNLCKKVPGKKVSGKKTWK